MQHVDYNYPSPPRACVLRKVLGDVILTTDGKGLYNIPKMSFSATVVAELDPKETTYTKSGAVEFAYGHFEIHFKKPFLPNFKGKKFSEIFVHPYTDRGVEEGLNAFLKSLGYTGTVNWSEQGRQTARHGDFDCDYILYREIFPEAFKRTA